ncbi:hypothetical protein CDV31_012457 [Fusarium ambrosium]|uniref:Uncharacterized protein n=1 Tax=Fusarium ambrosium TaxID=131363 RepID=A0A428T9R3_9HYPO|nr:hypothetical protein CDV31_012457 [Fusarium ambrosium]
MNHDRSSKAVEPEMELAGRDGFQATAMHADQAAEFPKQDHDPEAHPTCQTSPETFSMRSEMMPSTAAKRPAVLESCRSGRSFFRRADIVAVASSPSKPLSSWLSLNQIPTPVPACKLHPFRADGDYAVAVNIPHLDIASWSDAA